MVVEKKWKYKKLDEPNCNFMVQNFLFIISYKLTLKLYIDFYLQAERIVNSNRNINRTDT